MDYHCLPTKANETYDTIFQVFFFFDVLNNGTAHNMLIIDHFYIIY